MIDKPSRRHVLFAGSAAAAAGLSAPAFGQHDHNAHGDVLATEKKLGRAVSQATGDPIRFPDVRRAENGVLETTLRMAYGPTDVDGERAIAMTYDGSYPGPTLVARPGDTIRIRLINDLDDVTNLHTHGLHVSP